MARSAAERDAMPLFRPGSRTGCVENLFLKLNPEPGRALWLRIAFLRRGDRPQEARAEAWAIAFGLADDEGSRHVPVREQRPSSEARIALGAFEVQVANVELGWGHTRGELTDPDSGDRVAWELRFDPEGETFHHLPYEWMYRTPVPKTKATTPVMDTRFEGTVDVNGRETRIREAPGMLGHNWGSQNAEAWTWVHCNAWSGGERLAFEGITSRVGLGPVTSPWVTALHVRWGDERIDLKHPRHLLGTDSHPEGLSWRFEGYVGAGAGPSGTERAERRVVGHLEAPPDRFVGANYHEPDGRVAHCLNSKIADGEIRIERWAGGAWETEIAVRADRSAALEVGTREQETHGVPIRIP